MRPNKNEYYLNIAAEVAKRSTCLRRQYGAIIVKNDEIIATGEAHNIPHGEQYEKCVSVHAEQNAIISARRQDMIGATLYLAGWENGTRMAPGEAQPCTICWRLIKNAGIKEVVS